MALADVEGRIVVRDEASATFDKVQKEAKDTGKQMEDTGKDGQQMGNRMRSGSYAAVTGFSALATSGFSLYQSIDRVSDMQVQVDRANYMVKISTEAVERAQNAYNVAVDKYGADSPQAIQAAENLKLAQEKLQIVTDRAKVTQDNQNEAMISATLMVIPTLITGIKGAKDVMDGLNLSGGTLTSGLKTLTTGLGNVQLSAVSVGAALGAIAVIFGAFTTNNEAARIGLSLLAGGLIAAATAEWVLNAAVAAGLELSTLGMATVIVGVALASAAAVYAAAAMFGAKTEGGGVPSLPTRRREYIRTSAVAGVDVYFGEDGKCVQGPDDWIGLTRDEIKTKFGFQHGGIVERPTAAYLAEAGTEIVLPESGRTSPAVIERAARVLTRIGAIPHGISAGIGQVIIIQQDIKMTINAKGDPDTMAREIIREFRRKTGVVL